MKGYVLYRPRPESSSDMVRHDREAGDKLTLVASLEELVPADAELSGLVVDDGESWEARCAPQEQPEVPTGPGLAPVTPIFGLPRSRVKVTKS